MLRLSAVRAQAKCRAESSLSLCALGNEQAVLHAPPTEAE